jgi:glycerol uptake facilitator-like aquaporin
MISYQITGAEFNPATTIGRVFAIKDYKNFKAALLTIGAQYLGSLFGIFWVFFMLDQNGKIGLKPESTDQLFTDLLTMDTYWARLIGYEVLMTAFFTIIYLILRFESSMKKVDRIVKGIACSITLGACLTMTNGAGASLNPALGFA